MMSNLKHCLLLTGWLFLSLGGYTEASENSPVLVVAVDVSLNSDALDQAHYAASQAADHAEANAQRIAVVAFSDFVETVIPAQSVTSTTREGLDQLFSSLPGSAGPANVAVGTERALSEIEASSAHLLLVVSSQSLTQLQDQESDQFKWLSRVLIPDASSRGIGMTLVTSSDGVPVDPVLNQVLNSLSPFSIATLDSDIGSLIATRIDALQPGTSSPAPTETLGPLAGSDTEPTVVETAQVEPTVIESAPVEPSAQTGTETSSQTRTEPSASTTQSQPESASVVSLLSQAMRQTSLIMWAGVLFVVLGSLLLIFTVLRHSKGRKKIPSSQSNTTVTQTPAFPEDDSDHYLPLDSSASRSFSRTAISGGSIAQASSAAKIDHNAVTVVHGGLEDEGDEETVIKHREGTV